MRRTVLTMLLLALLLLGSHRTSLTAHADPAPAPSGADLCGMVRPFLLPGAEAQADAPRLTYGSETLGIPNCAAGPTGFSDPQVWVVLKAWESEDQARFHLTAGATAAGYQPASWKVGDLSYEKTWPARRSDPLPEGTTLYGLAFTRQQYLLFVSGDGRYIDRMQELAKQVNRVVNQQAWARWYASVELFSGHPFAEVLRQASRAGEQALRDAAQAADGIVHDYLDSLSMAESAALSPEQRTALEVASLVLWLSPLQDEVSGAYLFPNTNEMLPIVIDMVDRALAGDAQAASALPPFVGLLIGMDMGESPQGG